MTLRAWPARLAVLSIIVAGGAAAAPRSAHAQLRELKWSTEGYFRTRTVTLTNLAPQDRSTFRFQGEDVIIPDIRNTSYVVSRLRIMPTLAFEKLAKLQFQLDAMDDVLWGDNNGLSSAPLFATDASNQNFLGGSPGDSVTIRRAWLEFLIPVGLMRVGRMPSHWGMGLLANGGGTANVDPTAPVGEERKAMDYFFDDDFGDNHFGSTADRILFATRPLTIAKTAMKKSDTSSNLIVGYAFDKLSEAPFLAFEEFEREFRPFGQQGFISRGRNDDVNEHVVLALYNNADWDQIRYTDELRFGFYGVMRDAKEGSTNPSRLDPTEFCGSFDGVPTPCVDTGSRVYIADLWWRLRYGPYFTEGELVKIWGKTFGGVPFPSRNQKKDASITGAVARVGYLTEMIDGVLEVGHASGDDVLEDEHFKQRALHPDFNVGLILFEETLRELSARAYGPPFFTNETPNGATGFFSNGGVINANYIHPKVRYRPRFGPLLAMNMEIIGALLLAKADKLATGAALFRPCDGPDLCFEGQTDSKYLGTEVDLAVRLSFAKHMRFTLETGYLRFGKALKSVLPNADSSFTLQSSVAFVW
jgi:hypothetical protein